jgi:glycerate kinase
MRLVRVTNAVNNAFIYINPEQIVLAMPATDGTTGSWLKITANDGDGKNVIRVMEPITDVLAALEKEYE